MKINKQILELCGVTEQDYREWCAITGKPMYKESSKREFFKRIQNGQLVKDKNGKLIKKRRTSK